MKRLIVSVVVLLVLTWTVYAETVGFQATVSNARVSLDEVLQLTLTLTGVNSNVDPVNLPVLDGFSAKYVGPSTSVSIINGDYHSERSFVYNLFPNKLGHFQIPVISVVIAGQTYTTKPIDVDVVQGSAVSSRQDQPSAEEGLKDKVLLIASLEKTDLYLNERVPLTIKLLVNGVPVRDIQYPQWDKTGWTVDDFDKPQQSSGIFNGVRYDTVEFKTFIYPNHLGDLHLGPITLSGNVLYKNSQENPFNQDSNFFGTNVFNNFFDSYASRPITLTSEPITVHVTPLPLNHRPPDFSGAIGVFDFQASVSPLQVKAGDPLTLTMTIKGNGNFKNLKIPLLDDQGFKTYAPHIKNGVDEKTAEEVIIPTSAGIKEVPRLQFSYFDTRIKDYKTITQGPFTINVLASNPEQEFKAVGFSNLAGVEPSVVPARHHFSLDRLLRKIQRILKKVAVCRWFWMGCVLILIAGVSYYAWRRFQERLLKDPALARRLKAVKEAKKALMPARQYIVKGQMKDFYALVSKVLIDYLANKWHESSMALSVAEILERLRQKNIDAACLAQIKTILEQSDLVCFASVSRDATQMFADLHLTEHLITHLEQHLT